ncbi:ATP-binding protein [Nisaea acidiphila]|uniref:histidine kinase n=1 Tax=Nisaea acidiphila TaxID=1862145 RepID=A0A9J7AXK4_9PROT|nr:ATP-binding protein [Nisaea acidiphila]UUX50149.1 ATP-binding protein [Nisaea acidiphila]
MKAPFALSLRSALTLLFVVTPLVAMIVVGSIALAVRLPQIAEENSALAKDAASDVAARLEGYLRSLEDRFRVLANAIPEMPVHEIYHLLESARGGGLDAIFLLDKSGTLVDASIEGYAPEFVEELEGIDMSGNKLFREVLDTGAVAWSDTHLSAITGKVTVGVAAPVHATGQVIIGEIPLQQIVSISRFTRSGPQLELWIIDRLGEVVADTGMARSGRQNLYHLPIVRAAIDGLPFPDRLTFNGRKYFAGAEYSESFGWLFVSRIPSGMDNAATRNTVAIIIVGFVATSILGALLAPLWAQVMTKTVQSVIGRSRMLASGQPPSSWPSSPIREFDQLSKDLEAMAGALVNREETLKGMNEALETRVQERTRDLEKTNAELSETLGNLQLAQGELIEAEKLAALGRLVAGVAHELNTPLGNSKLSLSAQEHEIKRFEELVRKGLRKSDLTAFIDRMKQGTSVAGLNIDRACNLIVNFKQVAVDRTASYRRNFRLSELVSSTVLTLEPSIRKEIEVVVEEIPDRIELDSYPGEFGQVITNLIDNANKHAFPDKAGNIRLTVSEPDPGTVCLTVEDNGIGMEKNVVEQVFNPFFTTKFGQGGTGLGMHIAHNAVTNILGGTLTVTSVPGEGTRFVVTVPLVAPEPDAEAESEDATRSTADLEPNYEI